MSRPSPFRSFFQGGFECSTHRRRDGVRLDLIAATRHDVFARKDYEALQRLGIATVRDGIRWHLIEKAVGRYDFSSVIPMLRAARVSGTQVIWDLCHYGWPDDLDIFSAGFASRFGRFARAFAKLLREESDGEALIAPLNEPSFLSWAGGEVKYINPFQKDRGFELKRQLVRATIEAAEAVWTVSPNTRLVQCEPAIHITADPLRPQDAGIAEDFRLFQFQSLDMLAGFICPELGGDLKYLDLVGLNFYWNNQWIHQGRTLLRGDPSYRPFRELLRDFHARYRRPVFVAETGTENADRPQWLNYVCAEAQAAKESGVPVHGICLYPILNHPGWDNGRHCHCGLLDYADERGNRECYQPLADELRVWEHAFDEVGQREFATAGGR